MAAVAVRDEVEVAARDRRERRPERALAGIADGTGRKARVRVAVVRARIAQLLVEPLAKSEIIDLVGPAYSARDMAHRLGEALGKNVRVVEIPAAEHVTVLTQKGGLPKPFAEAVAEMFACFASGRVSPQGDRLERGATTLDEVLREGLHT